MRNVMIATGLSLTALAGCTENAAQIPTSPRPEFFQVSQMPDACRHEASVRYAQLPGNIIMEPAVMDTSGGYSVRGTYATTNMQHSIGCRFTANGEYIGLGRV
ncbi:hypothetical protein [Qingshengfaniella alkalisoli]|uniref:Lipoprotein n=1 Tax=Qingshengfaniella alkalisoli TaxID=2599296 RepID=A0A5B8IT60_9RHOB|nr:hypothetical protein [Qingshengfaniella alkalisoli]QDY68814.1 hypothetical protein FPZ52_03670 [Qingshengfaniella alkalisoli]